MYSLTNYVRYESDPKVVKSGPGSLSSADRLGRMLGWFSIGLGLAQLLAPGKFTRALGVEGKEALVRSCGAREIGTGMMTLSTEKHVGLWSRVAGDGLDLASLLPALRRDNPRRGNVAAAFALVMGVALLDYAAAQAITARRRRRGRPRSYRDRSGFPNGITSARGAARDALAPPAMRKRRLPAHEKRHTPAGAGEGLQ